MPLGEALALLLACHFVKFASAGLVLSFIRPLG